jgi:hypothetical protein
MSAPAGTRNERAATPLISVATARKDPDQGNQTRDDSRGNSTGHVQLGRA